MGKRKYDNTHRREMADLRKLAGRLEAVRDAEKKERRRDARTRKERRRDDRVRVLPPDRVCPTCRNVNLVLIQWVIDEENNSVQCVTCYRDPEKSANPEAARQHRAKLSMARTARTMREGGSQG